MLPQALKSCPKCNKSPNLVTLATILNSVKYILACLRYQVLAKEVFFTLSAISEALTWRKVYLQPPSNLGGGEDQQCKTTFSATVDMRYDLNRDLKNGPPWISKEIDCSLAIVSG